MSNLSRDIESVEHQINGAKELIKKREMINRLAENADFKVIFNQGFFLEDAARFAQLSADPALNELQRADSLAIAQASGHVRRYLSMICQQANVAEDGLQNANDTLDDLRTHTDESYGEGE